MSLFYYIQSAEGTVYELDCTTSVSKTVTGKLTDNPVESGANLSDHYVHNPDTFSLEGVISDIKVKNNTGLKPAVFIAGLNKIKEEKQVFSFHFGEKIPETTNCMFTSMTVRQSKANGHLGRGGGIDSFRISATFRKVDFAEQASAGTTKSTIYRDKAAEEKESAQTTQAVTLLTGSALSNAISSALTAQALGNPLTDAQKAVLGSI